MYNKYNKYNKHINLFFIITFQLFFLFIFFYFINNYLSKKNIENFQVAFDPFFPTTETFSCTINDNFDIIDKQKTINYNDSNNQKILGGHIGQNILFNVKNKFNNKNYIILRYPDFRDEILRHSKENLLNYFNYLKKTFIKNNENYIFDFAGYHGIIDDKVRLWIKLKETYNRELANTVMPTTYLMPNDYDIFMNEYDENKKYILKNSFGGARSALKITISKDEILSYFEENKSKKYDPYQSIDAASHSKVKYNIIQEYIEPTFLLHNHKFALRLYLIVVNDTENESNSNGVLCKLKTPLPEQALQGSAVKFILWNNGLCYYSEKEYQNSKNIDLDKNVVGSILKEDMKQIIKKYNLPKTYNEFKTYAKQNIENCEDKINNLEQKLQEYFKYIFESNKDELHYFKEYKNIEKFGIFAFDIEIDNNFNPTIFEGNYYFARFNTNMEYGLIIKKLYEDILYELQLSDKKNYGFIEV